jgi:four helix bundle protein
MRSEKENEILKLSFDFALHIIEYCELLEQNRKYVISKQLLKSGTSIGANVREAQDAESKADFIHKMKIAAKESNEVEYWLHLCNLSQNYPNCEGLIAQHLVIKKLLSKILGTLLRPKS